jgi:hypothetical protein
VRLARGERDRERALLELREARVVRLLRLVEAVPRGRRRSADAAVVPNAPMLIRRWAVARPSTNSCAELCPATKTLSCQAPADGAVNVLCQRQAVPAGRASPRSRSPWAEEERA